MGQNSIMQNICNIDKNIRLHHLEIYLESFRWTPVANVIKKVHRIHTLFTGQLSSKKFFFILLKFVSNIRYIIFFSVRLATLFYPCPNSTGYRAKILPNTGKIPPNINQG